MTAEFDVEKYLEENEDARYSVEEFVTENRITDKTETEFVKRLFCGIVVKKNEFKDIPVERQYYLVWAANEQLHSPYGGEWMIIPVITDPVFVEGDLVSCTMGYRAVIVHSWETGLSDYQKYMK